jgi:hypothetical protein
MIPSKIKGDCAGIERAGAATASRDGENLIQESVRFGLVRSRLVLILLGIATLTTFSSAQEVSDSAEFELWADIATIYKINERLRYDGDYGVRSWLTTRGFRLTYFRPSVRYRAKRWLMLHGGVAWFHTAIEDRDNVNELRPWVGLRILGPRPGKFVFSNYFRAELRSFKGGNITDWETRGRARYQLQVTTPRFNIGRAEKFHALTFAEVFKNFGSSVEELFLAQFRFNVGIGKQINRGLRIEVNYLFQKVNIEGTGLEPSDHILRTRLFYSFN